MGEPVRNTNAKTRGSIHILHIDPQHWFDFTALGHTETIVQLVKYETSLEEILATLPTPPDFIIQQETLGARKFITGLEHAPCPTAFLAFDAHLNLYWQQYYGKLFDAVLTPHLSLFHALPPDNRHPQVFRCNHAGTDIDWSPHTTRQHPLAFCGRITPERPLRSWMTRLLTERFGLTVQQSLSREDMFQFYRNARIIPNEAICFEVNWRLFETASAGAVPLTPDCGPDQDAAFTNGKEMLVYADGQDLYEKAGWLLNHPTEAEHMGRRAWERVQREHLPKHRAREVCDLLTHLSQARAIGRDAAVNTWLTRLERAKTGDAQHPLRSLLAQGEELAQTHEVLTGLLHLLGTPSRKNTALAFCRDLLVTETGADSAICNATASACALAHDDTVMAWSFFTRHTWDTPVTEKPISGDPLELCRAWAEDARMAGRPVRPGFTFRPEVGHLPACALEFLLFAEHLGHRNEWLSQAQSNLLAPFPAYAPYRLGLLQSLRRHAMSPAEAIELSQLLFFCCRVDEGKKLLLQAKDL